MTESNNSASILADVLGDTAKGVQVYADDLRTYEDKEELLTPEHREHVKALVDEIDFLMARVYNQAMLLEAEAAISEFRDYGDEHNGFVC